MTGHREVPGKRTAGAVLLTMLLLSTVPVPSSGSRPRCDRPVFGDTVPVDVELPHDLSTGRDIGVAVVDTGVSAPGVVADRPGDRDSCLLHGTAVAGTLRTVAPASRIVSVRQGDGDHDTTVADLVTALDRARTTAADHGVRIVNISVIACDDTAELRASVAAAEDAGLLLIAAAGNTGQCQDGQVPYPAALPEVLTVGGIDARHTDDLNAGRRPADYSVPGGWVDLYAPGGPVSAVLESTGDLQNRTIVGDPAPFSGTSFAAPVVAGAAALVWQVRPEFTAAQVRSLLIATADQGVVPVVSPVRAVGAAMDAGTDAGTDADASGPEGRQATRYEVPAEVSVSRPVSPARDLRIPLLLAGAVVIALLTGVILRFRR
ncbi:S8 family serine peptidase [Corynebacterium sp.]|uniref:S8 family serine peptidase n=1 Tax=Corynebacterium sp. TaxID=1720 RepID=UPI0028AD63FE|nr:S8 family serine peptidase [Corynebacterium sp.]